MTSRAHRPFALTSGVAGCVLAGMLLVGCGSQPSNGSGSQSPGGTSTAPTSTPTSSGASSAPGGSGTPSGPVRSGSIPTPPRSQSGPTVTVTGSVHLGAAPRCLLLTLGSGQQFLLTGPLSQGLLDKLGPSPRDRLDASKVTVRGHVAPDRITYCQAGRPFVADHIIVHK